MVKGSLWYLLMIFLCFEYFYSEADQNPFILKLHQKKILSITGWKQYFTFAAFKCLLSWSIAIWELSFDKTIWTKTNKKYLGMGGTDMIKICMIRQSLLDHQHILFFFSPVLFPVWRRGKTNKKIVIAKIFQCGHKKIRF